MLHTIAGTERVRKDSDMRARKKTGEFVVELKMTALYSDTLEIERSRTERFRWMPDRDVRYRALCECSFSRRLKEREKLVMK